MRTWRVHLADTFARVVHKPAHTLARTQGHSNQRAQHFQSSATTAPLSAACERVAHHGHRNVGYISAQNKDP
jgi:hypothetical protein